MIYCNRHAETMNIETQNGYVFSIFGKDSTYHARKIRAIMNMVTILF